MFLIVSEETNVEFKYKNSVNTLWVNVRRNSNRKSRQLIKVLTSITLFRMKSEQLEKEMQKYGRTNGIITIFSHFILRMTS